MGVLVLFASWEERCRLGFDVDLSEFEADELVVFFFRQYASVTEDSRRYMDRECEARKVRKDFICVDLEDVAGTWHQVVGRMRRVDPTHRVLLDVTTMPREIVWYCMWALDAPRERVRCVYHSPHRYGPDWLSRNPMRPRLVYKLSGLSVPDRKTALLLTVGFDPQRVQRVIDWLEPEVLLVGTQSASDFERNDSAMDEYRADLAKRRGCLFFDLDVYTGDHGLSAVAEALDEVVDSHNVVMTSLGPKISAVTLYRLKCTRESVGLIYTPASEYNLAYSKGIRRTFYL